MRTCNRLADRKISRADERESDRRPLFPPGVLLKTLSFIPFRFLNTKWQSKSNDELFDELIVCTYNKAHKQLQSHKLTSSS